MTTPKSQPLPPEDDDWGNDDGGELGPEQIAYLESLREPLPPAQSVEIEIESSRVPGQVSANVTNAVRRLYAALGGTENGMVFRDVSRAVTAEEFVKQVEAHVVGSGRSDPGAAALARADLLAAIAILIARGGQVGDVRYLDPKFPKGKPG